MEYDPFRFYMFMTFACSVSCMAGYEYSRAKVSRLNSLIVLNLMFTISFLLFY